MVVAAIFLHYGTIRRRRQRPEKRFGLCPHVNAAMAVEAVGGSASVGTSQRTPSGFAAADAHHRRARRGRWARSASPVLQDRRPSKFDAVVGQRGVGPGLAWQRTVTVQSSAVLSPNRHTKGIAQQSTESCAAIGAQLPLPWPRTERARYR